MYRRILCKEVNALNKVFEAIASWWEWMVSIAMNFQFKDAVDIIIVAFLIYGVVKLVRETRAGQLVKGLFLLVILFIISSYFNLVMVSRVLAYFFQFAFVAILIVFQPRADPQGNQRRGRRRGYFTTAQNGCAYRIRAQNEAWRHH